MTQQLSAYQQLLDQLTDLPAFGLRHAEKTEILQAVITQLHALHLAHCPEYANLFANTGTFTTLAQAPYLAVRLFKLLTLKSIPTPDIFRVAHSSGTTGSAKAQIVLDKATSQRQTRVAVKIFQDFIGKKRLPMLIIDHPNTSGHGNVSARAAAIQAMSVFGRTPVYALNADLSLNKSAIEQFTAQHADAPVLLFGFTFLVYEYFVKALASASFKCTLPQGILIHGGGWKKLQAQSINNTEFNAQIHNTLGIERVHDYYGMAEQLGSVFVACEEQVLHAPNEADIIVRCPKTLAPLPMHQAGIIQVLSALPTSYPGFSLLTEDKGIWLGEDDCPCGRKGRYFKITGRLPKTDVRGCSDTQGHTP